MGLEEKKEGSTVSNSGSFKNFNDIPNPNATTPAPQKKESFTGDFIVVSEFSEKVGPIPLYVIPEGGEGTFNLNDFVLKIMAVDVQNKSNDPQSYLKDSQVVMPEPSENAFAYVCISYIIFLLNFLFKSYNHFINILSISSIST